MDQAVVNISPHHDCCSDLKLLLPLGQGHDKKRKTSEVQNEGFYSAYFLSPYKYDNICLINTFVTEVDGEPRHKANSHHLTDSTQQCSLPKKLSHRCN